jgi:hypothetical protein
VGDAAFAFDPIAGQGIRFALASAFAAVPLLRTWFDNGPEADAEAGVRFYETFVTQARTRHLKFLARSPLESAGPRFGGFPSMVIFCGQTRRTELNVDSRIVVDEAVLVEGIPASGETVRSVGGVDLLLVEELARSSVSTRVLIDRLAVGDITRARAASVVEWCLRRHVLRPVPSA